MFPLAAIAPFVGATAGMVQVAPTALKAWDVHQDAKAARETAKRQQLQHEIQWAADLAGVTVPILVKVVQQHPGYINQARIRRYERKLAAHLGHAADAATRVEQEQTHPTGMEQAELNKWRRRAAEHTARADDYRTRLQSLLQQPMAQAADNQQAHDSCAETA